jgi:hypothetical protein
MLDKRLGLTLGSELVAPLDFTSGWTNNNITSDTSNSFTTSSTGGKYKDVVTTGKWYRLSGNISTSAGTLAIWNAAGPSNQIVSTTSGVNFSVLFYALTDTIYFRVNAAATVTVNSISVRELPGNHAFTPAAASTARPTVSARVNLLTKTEQFDDAVWTKTGATITANTTATTDPLGGTTADKLVETATTSTHLAQQSATSVSGVTYTASASLKAAERTIAAINVYDTADRATYFDLQNGVVLSSAAGNTATIAAEGNGWYRCTVTRTTAAATTFHIIHATTANNTLVYAGVAGSGIYVWGADLRPTNDGVGLPDYQRVNTATDYDPVGFPVYLRFDGSDDFLQTNTITPGTDKVQVFAGVRKLSDATNGCIAELSASVPNNSGTFAFFTGSPIAATAQYHFTSHGAAAGNVNQAAVSTNTFAAPITNIITGTADISADLTTFRANGATNGTTGTGDQGAGNYLAYPLYIGRRGGTTLAFNGRLYGMVGRFGSTLPDGTIVSTEAYLNTKTRAF